MSPYLFNRLPFPEGSRLAGVWVNTWIDPPIGEEIGMGQFIDLPSDQDPVVESDFLSSHLPFNVGGLYGVYPDGQGWLFVVQAAPVSAAEMVGASDPGWVLVDALDRALQFNEGVALGDSVHWDRPSLSRIYSSRGVAPERVASWTVAELVWGLLAECCNVPLDGVVSGKDSGCAFPGEEHQCEGSVFTDVFARWTAGLLSSPPEADDASGPGPVDGEDEGDLTPHSSRDKGTDLDRIELEVTRRLLSDDYAVSVGWLESGELHAALCDYGDGPELGEGLDIPDPLKLLDWLIVDRFGHGLVAVLAYCRSAGIEVLTRPAEPDDYSTPVGQWVRVHRLDGTLVLRAEGSDAESIVLVGWHRLVLRLLADRCAGEGSWAALRDTLSAAGVTPVDRWRGYF